MIPDYDPAVARVLETFGRLLPHGSEAALGQEEVMRALAEEQPALAAELAKDADRARRVLDQLCTDGLLEARMPGGSGVAAQTFGLTSLGWARIDGTADVP